MEKRETINKITGEIVERNIYYCSSGNKYDEKLKRVIEPTGSIKYVLSGVKTDIQEYINSFRNEGNVKYLIEQLLISGDVSCAFKHEQVGVMPDDSSLMGVINESKRLNSVTDNKLNDLNNILVKVGKEPINKEDLNKIDFNKLINDLKNLKNSEEVKQ